MRFVADENVSRRVIEQLRAAGFEVASIREMRPGISDSEVLEAANAKDCILITEDHDYGELVIRQRLRVRGVILLELDRLPNTTRADMVSQVVCTQGDRLFGNLLVIEPGRIRIRPLPHG